jgi:acetyl esterase/lipase
LAGGQKIDVESLVEMPIFLGVGERDFLARSVRALHDSLTDAGAKAVTYREYPDLEHLVIVQEALPDVFAFFDGIVKKK